MINTVKKIIGKNASLKENIKKINDRVMIVLSKLSPELATRYIYRIVIGKKLNLKNPKSFNEKIQWLKLYWESPLLIKCADKYEVRKYIEECGCSEILNELYSVYNSIVEINWESLPNKFVLKTTNGCDTNIICRDKAKLNKEEVLGKFNNWLNMEFGLTNAEVHYSKIKPKIICERYLETEQGVTPNDYKFFCFNGNPKFLYVGVVENGYTHKTYYDLQWNKLDFLKEGYKTYDFKKPACLDEMNEYAKKLSKPFPFVRVDFYDYNGVPIFGEMTFTPTGGLAKYYRNDVEQMLGDWIILPIK